MPEQNNNNINQTNKPIIEIPQEYYNKINKEEEEKAQKEREYLENQKINASNREEAKNLFSLAMVSAIVIFISYFCMVNVNKYAFFIPIIYIIVGAISNGLKYKKNSNFPPAVLVGGIIVAIITFIVSIINETNIDIWTHYAIASGVTGIIGVITSSIITWYIYDRENIKALQTIGILLYFTILIGIPYYIYKKYPDKFYEYVFFSKTEVIATTEKEFTEKTLKNRYNITFSCNNGKHVNNVLKYVTIRHTCEDNNGNEINVESTAYNETEILYVVKDNYTDILYLKSLKEKLINNITSVTGGSVSIALYPHHGCSFVGDCSDCDEYMEIYKEENDLNNQYKFSTNLNLEKYFGMSSEEFVNEYEFKYIIDISGRFGGLTSSNYDNMITSILDNLNNLGVKNTYGYEITIKNSTEYNKPLYKVKGNTNDKKIFSNPLIIDLNK